MGYVAVNLTKLSALTVSTRATYFQQSCYKIQLFQLIIIFQQK